MKGEKVKGERVKGEKVKDGERRFAAVLGMYKKIETKHFVTMWKGEEAERTMQAR